MVSMWNIVVAALHALTLLAIVIAYTAILLPYSVWCDLEWETLIAGFLGMLGGVIGGGFILVTYKLTKKDSEKAKEREKSLIQIKIIDRFIDKFKMANFTFDIFIHQGAGSEISRFKRNMKTFYNAMTSYPISLSTEDEYNFDSKFIRRVAMTNGAISATIALEKEITEETEPENFEQIFKELIKSSDEAEKLIKESLPIMENFRNNLLKIIKNNT